MSEKEAKSAIEEIFSLSEKIEEMDKRLKIIDNNIKLIINKLNKTTSEPQGVIKAVAPKLQKNEIHAKSNEFIVGDIKVFGYIFNKLKEPIVGVKITVFNDENKIVKEKISNDSGYWSVRLPPGKYGVMYEHEFAGKKFKPINRVIELTEEIKELEVI